MKTKIYFIRHVDTLKDPNQNASKWVLSSKGEEQAREISELAFLQDCDVIFVSSEIKTYLTIEPLAKKVNIGIVENPDLDEVRRGDKFFTKEEFEIEKFKQLEELDYPAFGGETANQALQRFSNAVNLIKKTYEGKSIIIVSHGTILNLYFASILSKFSDLKNRWSNTKFGAIGIIEDNKVLKDICE